MSISIAYINDNEFIIVYSNSNNVEVNNIEANIIFGNEIIYNNIQNRYTQYRNYMINITIIRPIKIICMCVLLSGLIIGINIIFRLNL